MTELSAIGTANCVKPHNADLTGADRVARILKQGRAFYGIDMQIVNDTAESLPWDGTAFGDRKVRGPWVCSAYFGDEPGSALDADG